MSLIQFVNNLKEPLEEGDVIVIGQMKASSSEEADQAAPAFAGDLTDSAYDTRVCGIVYGLQVALKLDND